MPQRRKKKAQPKQGPPVAFRPGSELEHLVGAFASKHQLGVHEAFKDLAALAIVGLDGRYFVFLNQMAAATGGVNAFVRACLHVHAALEGAARERGAPIQVDPERTRFILETVRDYLQSRGRQLEGECPWLMPEPPPEATQSERGTAKLSTRPKRVVRPVIPVQPSEPSPTPESAAAQAQEEEPEFTAQHRRQAEPQLQ